jgi:Fe-S-cluster containining protein
MVERKLSAACQYCDGDCCKAINFLMKPPRRIAELVGAHYGRDPDEIDTIQIAVKHRCMYLTNGGKCSLFHEDPEKDQRPDYCKEYLCDKAKTPGLMILEADG